MIEGGIVGGEDGADIRPVGIQFVRDDGGQSGLDALAHLRSRHEEQDLAVAVHVQPGVGEGLFGRRIAEEPDGLHRRAAADQQPCPGGGAEAEEMTAIQPPRYRGCRHGCASRDRHPASPLLFDPKAACGPDGRPGAAGFILTLSLHLSN